MIDLKEMESAQQSAQRFNEAVAKAAHVSFERGYTDGFADGYKQGKKDAQPEIIYCKDCKHWAKTCGDNQWSLGNCGLFEKRLVMCKGYCAWAERRTDAH